MVRPGRLVSGALPAPLRGYGLSAPEGLDAALDHRIHYMRERSEGFFSEVHVLRANDMDAARAAVSSLASEGRPCPSCVNLTKREDGDQLLLERGAWRAIAAGVESECERDAADPSVLLAKHWQAEMMFGRSKAEPLSYRVTSRGGKIVREITLSSSQHSHLRAADEDEQLERRLGPLGLHLRNAERSREGNTLTLRFEGEAEDVIQEWRSGTLPLPEPPEISTISAGNDTELEHGLRAWSAKGEAWWAEEQAAEATLALFERADPNGERPMFVRQRVELMAVLGRASEGLAFYKQWRRAHPEPEHALFEPQAASWVSADAVQAVLPNTISPGRRRVLARDIRAAVQAGAPAALATGLLTSITAEPALPSTVEVEAARVPWHMLGALAGTILGARMETAQSLRVLSPPPGQTLPAVLTFTRAEGQQETAIFVNPRQRGGDPSEYIHRAMDACLLEGESRQVVFYVGPHRVLMEVRREGAHAVVTKLGGDTLRLGEDGLPSGTDSDQARVQAAARALPAVGRFLSAATAGEQVRIRRTEGHALARTTLADCSEEQDALVCSGPPGTLADVAVIAWAEAQAAQ